MAPKKVEEPEKKPLIGRVGTNLKVGIVGIPNVGKSTFFNVLTKSQAAAENFPFCTIDPNENKNRGKYRLVKLSAVISGRISIYSFREMCEAELERLKLSSKSVKGGEKYSVNKSVITKRKYLRSIRGYPRPGSTSASWPPPKMTWYPKANMYYAFNEDTNPFTRVSGFVETVCNCSNRESIQPHFPPPSNPFTDRDPYAEDEARYKRLTTDPVCFAIFGKPGLNSKKLAKFIAEYTNCVLISPDILLEEEVEAKTDKGRWINQVLRLGRSVGPEIIMNLIESRLRGRDIMHKGYVVEGIPLIPNDPDLDYTAYPEAASVQNLAETPSFVADQGDREKSESEESPVDEYEYETDEIEDAELLESEKSLGSDRSRSYDLARNPFATESLRMILRDDYQWDIGNQIQDMFTTWPLKPTIIIYIMCPDPDVVHRRNQFRVDPHTGKTIDIGLWKMKEEGNVSSSKLNVGLDVELDEEITNEELLVDDDLKKHLLTRVSDMRSNVEVQCKIFERYALPCIEKQVLVHNPQHVIRVDGRTSATRMFQIVRLRLRTLALPRVILAKKMFDEDERLIGSEESSLFSIPDDFDGENDDEAFQNLMNKDVIAPRFRWRLSQWKFMCPVALAKGQKIEGSFRNAVRFMNKLYFLSSAAAAEIFIDNPRPFLLPPNPRPICKILVFGPKYSGKSNLAEVLAHTYGGKILDPRAIENREINHRRNLLITEAIDEILDDVIDELTRNLEIQREERETARKAALETWYKEAQVVADKLIRILENSPVKKKGDKTSENSSTIVPGLEEIRDQLEEYNLTSLCTDHDLFERILWDKNTLMDFAPTELLTMEAPVPEMDEQDPEVAEILAERTQGAHQALIELTNDEISRLLVANINAAQTAPNFLGLTESGWVVDGMYENVELLEDIIEKGVKIEEVVVIHETEPYNYLIKKWLKNYRDNFSEESIDEQEETINEDDNESHFFRDSEDELETALSKSSTPKDSEVTGLHKYVDELKQFEANWEEIMEKVQEIGAGLVNVELSENDNVESYVRQQIDSRYRPGASAMTDEEKDREAEDPNASVPDEELGEEEEETTREPTPPRDNRRLGDTGVFCPVALIRHHVLWKGKEEFSAVFMDKIYLLSSQVALDEFIHHPHEFVPFKKPLESIPALKISIVGPSGSGKSTLAMAISKEYGLVHVDFLERLDQYLKDRNIPLVGRRHEDAIAVNNEEAAELPEDLKDERYDRDKATIQTFVRKYLKEGAILPQKMLKECLMDFFQPPYRSVGLIFDHFPSSSYDAKTACDNSAVPELVIELICGVEETQKRMTSKLYDDWKEKQDKKKSEEELRFATEMQTVVENREKWVSRELKKRRRQRRAQIQTSAEEYEEGDEENIEEKENQEEITAGKSFTKSDLLLKTESDESSDSNIEEPDEIQAEIDRAELQEESFMRYQNAVKFEDWEDPDAAKERIRQEVSGDHESSSQNLATARAVFEENSILWIEVDAERSETSVLISVLKIVDPHIFRNAAALERVYEVDPDIAEKLLDCGYYLLSSFGRSCPVQMYENKIPFQMYLPAEAAEQIYPVLHRNYVYFLVGKERLAAFLEHPLKYLDQDSCTPLIPARIAIIGPPKCGKSTIANRFADTYGMKVITRGQALRELLKNFPWTELAILTGAHLQGGHTALNESIARAVELHSIDPRSATQGYILDGFPESQCEAEELAFLGIQPMVVIDLQADLDFCLSCSSADSDTLAKPPAYSPCYLSHQYEEWQVDAEGFRSWLSKFTQNVVTIDATAQKFRVWRKANDEVCLRFTRIKKYFRETDCDKAQSLTCMSVSPYEFRERQSKFESYCPACLMFDNFLTFSGTPPSNDGMVQFRDHYYWVCKGHLDYFLADALTILSSLNDVTLPKCRAEIVDQEIDVNHACWAKRLKVSGFCPVTYLDNLPRRNIVPGLNTLGVMFREDLYLFCSTECRDKFISQPTKYSDVNINFSQSLPPVKVNNLPNLGFLEQTVARLIVQAVNTVGVMRVKLPGMTLAVTAAIYIGVYLKIHNTENELNEIAIYEEVLRRMDARRHLLQVALRNAKKMINPHVSFPTEDRTASPKIQNTPQPPSSSITSIKFRHNSPKKYFTLEETRRVPVPDARFDYLCEYFKPLSKVPGFLNVVDIAGLVKGAAEGQGLGNAFLSHISACDAIFHLCRAFEDDDVTHIEGEVNPVRDFDIIAEELRLKDVEFLNGHLEKLEKLVVRGNDKKLKPEYETLLKVKTTLVDDKRHIRFADWSANDIEVLNKYLFLTSKPVIYLVNLSEKDYIRKKNKWLIKIKEWVDKNDPGAALIPFSGVFENKIFDMDDAERAKIFEENKVTSALDKIIVQGYKALQLQYFFTAGHDEVKAWTIPKGAKAPQAAGRIHTDFEKGFIMAEVMKFDDFKNEGSEAAVKAAGKYRQQGRNYVVEDGDIIFFKFNAGAGLKDAKKK